MKDEINQNEAITANSKQLELLKQHFPGCFDGKGSFQPLKLEEIVKASGADISREGYSLNWLGKSYARLLANENVHTLLAANTEHNSQPENKDSENLLIQGDNLEVLKHLVNAYREKVKMIYIDPPYNTGGDGFVYVDDRKFTVEEMAHLAGIREDEAKRILEFTQSNSNSHSAWLTFMFPRLYIARELLREDGVIFISIDENEQAQLKLLCDEVFGEENFVSTFIWSLPRGINAGHISRAHEYILVYSAQKGKLGLFNNIGTSSYSIDRCNKKIDARHPETKIIFPKGMRYEGKDQLIKGTYGGTEKVTPDKDVIFENSQLASEVGLSAGWTMKNMIEAWLAGKTVYDSKGQLIEEFFFKENGKLYSKKMAKFTSPKSIILDSGDNQTARTELDRLLGSEDYFSYPKPSNLIKKFANFATSKKDIILDFFSGSGTTAHAVMALNAEDGGNRKCISVQLDEPTDPKSEARKAGYKTIFEITRERIKRAAAKIQQEYPEAKCDYGFKEFRTISPFPGYLDEAETIEQYEAFEADKLTAEQRAQLMLTWQVYDGLPMHLDLTSVDLAGYTAHQGETLLYFMDDGLELKHIVALLERIDDDPEFAPRKLIILGQLLQSKAQREIKEAVSSYNNRKGIELTLDIRF